MLDSHDYKNAIAVQNASNISGVTYSLLEVIKKLRQSSEAPSDIENHPVVQAYVYKLMDMSLGLSPQQKGSDALSLCQNHIDNINK